MAEFIVSRGSNEIDYAISFELQLVFKGLHMPNPSLPHLPYMICTKHYILLIRKFERHGTILIGDTAGGLSY